MKKKTIVPEYIKITFSKRFFFSLKKIRNKHVAITTSQRFEIMLT